MRKKEKQLSTLLALSLVLGTYGVACAAGFGQVSDLTAQKGATSGNTIYYGAYAQDKAGTDYKKGSDGRYQGVAYKVLEKSGDNVTVMSDKIMKAGSFSNDGSTNVWSQSDLKKQLNDNADSYLNTAFSSKENGLLINSVVTAAGVNTTQKVYVLSVEEITKYFGVQAADFLEVHPELQAQVTDYSAAYSSGFGTGAWWLRSPNSGTRTTVDFVTLLGKVGETVPNNAIYGSRPTIQLNLDSVLFTSVAAEGSGKSGATAGGGFITPTDITSTSAVKLTMKDEATSTNTDGQQQVSVNTVSDTANLGMKYTIANAYTSEAKKDNQVIAGLIGDTNYANWVNYAHMASVAAGSTEAVGTAPLNGLADGTYGLSLYSEQANDWDKTDYAGAFKNIVNMKVKNGAIDELILKSTDVADPLTVDSAKGIVTLEETAYNQNLTAKNYGTYKLRDGKDISLNGTLTLNNGNLDMTKDRGVSTGNYNTLTVNNIVGTGALLLDTDLAGGRGDKMVINNAATSAGGTIQVYDASLVKNNKVKGNYNVMLVQDGSGNTTWTGKSLDTGGLWEITPTIEKKTDGNWYLTMASAKSNSSTDAVLGTLESGYGLWRSSLTDDTLRKRLGDLRYNDTEQGLWTRMKAGKLSASNYDSSYQTHQIGMDIKKLDTAYGFAVDYSRGTSTVTEGIGEASNTGLSIYASSYHKNGAYSDVVLRVGKVKADMKSYGQVEDRFDYSAWGYSASYGVGKTFTASSGFFVEPEAQLIYGHLNGGDYLTDKGTTINKDGINSFLGRVGFVAGRKFKDSDYYLKANMYREFAGQGSMNLAYDTEKMTYDGIHKDTWFELGLGGNVKLAKDTLVYGDVVKTFGADISKKWQVNVGVRWEF